MRLFIQAHSLEKSNSLLIPTAKLMIQHLCVYLTVGILSLTNWCAEAIVCFAKC